MKAAVQRRPELPAGQKSSFQLWLRWRTCAPLPVFFQRLWKLPASETSNGPVRREPWKLLMIFYGCHSGSTFKLCEVCFWLSSRSFLCLSGIRRFIWGHRSFGWWEAWGLLCRCNPPTTFPHLLHDSLRRLCLGPQITRQCCAIFLGLTLFLFIIYPFLFLHLKLWAFCIGIVLEKYWLKIDLFFVLEFLLCMVLCIEISIGKVLVSLFFTAFCIGILLEKSCFKIVTTYSVLQSISPYCEATLHNTKYCKVLRRTTKS